MNSQTAYSSHHFRLKDQRRITGVSNSTFLRWVELGIIPPGKKVGGCRMWVTSKVIESLDKAR